MPYVSPRGNVKGKIPAKKAPANATDGTSAPHQPSAELGEILASRDVDPAVVDSMDHWSGWNSSHHMLPDNDELCASVDPLDELEQKEVTESEVVSVQSLAVSNDAAEEVLEGSHHFENENEKISIRKVQKEGFNKDYITSTATRHDTPMKELQELSFEIRGTESLKEL